MSEGESKDEEITASDRLVPVTALPSIVKRAIVLARKIDAVLHDKGNGERKLYPEVTTITITAECDEITVHTYDNQFHDDEESIRFTVDDLWDEAGALEKARQQRAAWDQYAEELRQKTLDTEKAKRLKQFEELKKEFGGDQ